MRLIRARSHVKLTSAPGEGVRRGAGFMGRNARSLGEGEPLKNGFIGSPGGGRIQMCLRAEKLRDRTRNNRTKIDNSGNRATGELGGGGAVESIKDGSQRRRSRRVSPLLAILLVPL